MQCEKGLAILLNIDKVQGPVDIFQKIYGQGINL